MKITEQQLKQIIAEEMAKVLKEDDYTYVPYEVRIIRRIVKAWHGSNALPMLRILEDVPRYTKKVDPTILKAAVDNAKAMVTAHEKQADLNNAVIDDIRKKYPDSFKK
jgi:hypothetical protein